MPTQAKIDEVARLKEKLENAVSLVLADYRGLTANEMVELRERFTKQGLEYRVVKDTLARIAATEAGLAELAKLFSGPISLAVSYEDPAIAFKLSEECRKKYAPNYELRGGLFEGALVTETEVKRYATLPSREELLAKLAMLLSSPMRALAVMLQAKIRELAILLGEVAKKREQEPERTTDANVEQSSADASEAEEPQDPAEDEPATERQEAADEESESDLEAEPEQEAQDVPEENEQQDEQEEEA